MTVLIVVACLLAWFICYKLVYALISRRRS